MKLLITEFIQLFRSANNGRAEKSRDSMEKSIRKCRTCLCILNTRVIATLVRNSNFMIALIRFLVIILQEEEGKTELTDCESQYRCHSQKFSKNRISL